MRKEKIAWGVLLIVASIFMLVSKLGYLPGVNATSIILTIFLIAFIVKSAIRVNFPGILFPIAFISIIYSKQLGFQEITPWPVLAAALLGSIGLSMIFKKKLLTLNLNKRDYKEFEKFDMQDESRIAMDTSFGSSVKYINTDKFVQADLDCSFGALKVYFDNAKMLNEEAIVRLDASFSGVELYVPKTWRIESNLDVTLSGFNEKNRCIAETTNTLILIGDITFSGVDIIYV